jgi:hypothetical protein
MSFRKKRASSRRLAFEQLERREVLSGNVGAVAYQGTLFLSGDSASNQIKITSSASGKFTIAGADGTGTTVNKKSSQTFSGVHSLNIKMGNGNDDVRIYNQFGGVVAILGNLTIGGGEGTDKIDLNVNIGGTLLIGGEGGSDDIDVDGRVGGNAEIYGGSGNDKIDAGSFKHLVVAGSLGIKAGDGADRVIVSAQIAKLLSVYGDAGNDVLRVDNSKIVGNVNVFGGVGDDRIDFGYEYLTTYGGIGNEAGGYVYVYGGDGNDVVYASAKVTGDFYVDGQVGNDTVHVFQLSARDGYVYGGVGDDTLNLTEVTLRGVLKAFGSDGRDIIRVRSVSTVNFAWIDGAAGNDTFEVSHLSSLDVFVYGGVGNDTMDLTSVRSRRELRVIASDGDDVLRLLSTSVSGFTRIDGGTGVNRYYDRGGNTLGTFSKTKFS